jgi:dTDP-4-amino-4,6-dideoxygalactose transaminase
MIPLIRPIMPTCAAAERHFHMSIAASQFANFGPCYEKAVGRLESILGGHCVLTISGTAAVELALRAVSFSPSPRVLVPDYTHVGTLIGVVRAGGVPVLAAVDPMTWILRHADIAKANVDAVVVVNPFGYGVDTAAWDEQSDRECFDLVYDFAGAWSPEPIKARNPVCLSLHATKSLGIGEGGIVWFPDEMADVASEARRLSNFHILPDRTVASLTGFNGKMDELRCAYLLAALDDDHQATVANRIALKRETIRLYEAMIPGTSAPRRRDFSPSLCVLDGLPASELETASVMEDCVFRSYYPLLSRMPALAAIERVSVSPDAMAGCCALPSDVTLHEAMRVVDIVKRYL